MSRISNLTTALAATLLCAAPSLHAVELQSAGSDTKLTVYGAVNLYADYYVDAVNNGEPKNAGSLFYGEFKDIHGNANNQFLFSAAPTRLGFSTATPSSNLGDINTKIEFDLNNSTGDGTQVLNLRHYSIKFGGWTFGKSWSLWNDLDAGADTLDWGGPVGAACFDTPRYLQVSYVGNIDKNNSFGLSLEQNSGKQGGASGANTADYKIPTLLGMYTYAGDWGHIGVRVMGQNRSNFIPAGANNTPAKDRNSKMFAAAQLSGDVKFGKDDLVWNVYTGKAVGSYGIGIQGAVFDNANKDIYGYQNTGWTVGYTHNWTDKVRSNVVVSGVTFKSDDKIATTDGTTGNDLKTGTSVFVNTFVMLTKNLQFGAEYVYENAKAFGSNNVWADNDNKPVNKNTENKIHIGLKASF